MLMNRQAKRPIRRAIWKHIYINLIEIEWMLGIFAAFFIGAKNYWCVALFVGLSLVLGYATSYLYWYLIEKINGKDKNDEHSN